MASFVLKLTSLPFERQTFTHQLDGDFFNEIGPSEVRSADVAVTLSIERVAQSEWQIRIDAEGTMTVPCDRCLDDMTVPADTHYDLVARYADTPENDTDDGLLLMPAGTDELDTAPIIRDTLLLAIPITHSHDDERDCNAEMIARLNEHLTTEMPSPEPADDDATDPRWDALKKLQSDN